MWRWTRFREPALWLVAALLLIAGLLWVDHEFYGPGSEAYEHAREEDSGTQSTLAVRPEGSAYELHYETREQNEESEFLGRSSETWIALLTLVLAVSTILLWVETRRLALHAEREAREARRPIPIVKMEMADHAWQNEVLIVPLTLSNMGASPGFFDTFTGEVVFLPSDAPVPIPGDKRHPTRIPLIKRMLVLGPTESEWLRYWPKIPFDGWHMALARSKLISTYFLGHMTYSDADGNRRECGFCYTLLFEDDENVEIEHLARVTAPGANFDREQKQRSDNP